MNRIEDEDTRVIWTEVLKGVVKREDINLSSIHLDGTNFYTFIDTFNSRCEIPKYGKNKQKRDDLRQVNYSVFCSEDHQIPLFFDAYEGNRSDYTQFPQVIKKFQTYFQTVSNNAKVPEITLIFDKGNNSINNLNMIDEMGFHFVTSIRNSEAKKIAAMPSDSKQFEPCIDEELEGTYAYRTKIKILGKLRTTIATYSQNLFEREWKTINRNIDKALEKLKEYKQMLDDRIKGIEKKGKNPTRETVKKRCEDILRKPYLKELIKLELHTEKRGIPQIRYSLNKDALATYAKTSLGKTLLITSRDEWDTQRIIKAYRSQHIVEDVFKEMKNRETGSWWPMYHWTDSKIKVHALYCSIALLFRTLMIKRVKEAEINISMKRLLKELDDIKEVVNVTPRKGRQKKNRQHTVLTKMSELQKSLVSILKIDQKNEQLGDTAA